MTYDEFDSPWRFSTNAGNDDAGRFDLSGERGTSYWAHDPIGAFFEKLVDPDDLDAIVPQSALDRLVVWRYAPDTATELADTTAKRGGLPKEIGAATTYEQSWRWAAALDADGRGGLIAWSRVAPHACRSVVFFGPGGPAPACRTEQQFPAIDWLDELVELGLVEPTPTLGALPPAST